MKINNFVKTGIAVGTMVAASMFGFSAAFGYGGGGGGISYAAPCTSVAYADWQTSCVNGVQYRNVISQTPAGCVLTASQQASRSRTCTVTTTPAVISPTTGGEVLGVKVYADGTLLRGSDHKIYVLTNGALSHIKTLKDLAKYAGQPILNVSDSVISSYRMADVLGVKRFGDGQLIRDHNVKVYVIINGKKKHILDIPELAKFYSGLEIHNISADELAQYPDY